MNEIIAGKKFFCISVIKKYTAIGIKTHIGKTCSILSNVSLFSLFFTNAGAILTITLIENNITTPINSFVFI